MHNAIRIIAAFTMMSGTTGCVGMAMDDARQEALAQCDRKGGVFEETEAVSQGGVFGTVMVTGECYKPGDDGYEDALERAGGVKPKDD